MKKIILLGASGSIGSNTIEILKRNKRKYQLIGFSVFSQIDKIEVILKEFKSIKMVSVKSLKEIGNIIEKYPNITFVEKEKGLEDLASLKCDVLINAIVGFAGLKPTIKAIESKNNIALANKETLVVAGDLIMELAKQNNVKIVPIDSEHSAIFQCLEKGNKPHKLILTASGGPFFKLKLDDLKNVSVEDALKHPTWKMGRKITIDSATMFNKAFEIIEAHHLFQMPLENIEVLIHPQSIIHSMVEFQDGSIKAQLGVSDMKIPIAYALSYPKRLSNVANFLDFATKTNLEFYKVDLDRFIAIKLAYEVLKEKGTYPCVLNAANEEAVDLFLNKKITFLQIFEIVEKTLNAHINNKDNKLSLNDILLADKWAREYVRRIKL